MGSSPIRITNPKFKGGLIVRKFYFTFGLSEKFPYQGGWVEVFAPDRTLAVKTFRSRFPDRNEGVINCSDIYTEEQFRKTEMVNDNLGAACHEVLFCEP